MGTASRLGWQVSLWLVGLVGRSAEHRGQLGSLNPKFQSRRRFFLVVQTLKDTTTWQLLKGTVHPRVIPNLFQNAGWKQHEGEKKIKTKQHKKYFLYCIVWKIFDYIIFFK